MNIAPPFSATLLVNVDVIIVIAEALLAAIAPPASVPNSIPSQLPDKHKCPEKGLNVDQVAGSWTLITFSNTVATWVFFNPMQFTRDHRMSGVYTRIWISTCTASNIPLKGGAVDQERGVPHGDCAALAAPIA